MCVCVCNMRVCACLRVRARNDYKRTDQGHDIGFWLGPIKHFPPPSPWPIFFRLYALSRVHTRLQQLFGLGGRGWWALLLYNFFLPGRKTKFVGFFFYSFTSIILPTRSPPSPEQHTTFGFPFIHHFRFRFVYSVVRTGARLPLSLQRHNLNRLRLRLCVPFSWRFT